MDRKVTLVSGQWADLPLVELLPMIKSFGYDGVELCCWGDHFDVDKAAADQGYCDDLRALLEESGLILNEGEKAVIVAEEDRRRGLSAKRFEQVVAAMTSVSFSEGRMQQLKTELKAEVLTSSQAWALVELFDFSRDRVEALVFLHPQIVDPENFSDLLSGLKFESDRETVCSRLGLDG